MRNFRVGILFSIAATILCVVGCKKDPSIKLGAKYLMSLPEGFPSILFPEGNEFTQERWQLGKKLFYDPILSNNLTVSCASCHLPQFSFSDTVALSKGINNLNASTNSPSLANIGYHPYFTRAGGARSLEIQVNVPIQEHNEFDADILVLAERLKADAQYTELSLLAYGRIPDPFVITRAIATFERSLISGNSSYDKYTYQNKPAALNESEKAGMQLFFGSKANCVACHSGFNFTNYAFENNGLLEVYIDSGRMRMTKLETDRDRFKVPSLRNVALTAPYMHDGSIHSLEEVVALYNAGGHPHKNKNTALIKPLGLTDTEQKNLVAFLQSLTDYEFVNNKIYQNEK